MKRSVLKYRHFINELSDIILGQKEEWFLLSGHELMTLISIHKEKEHKRVQEKYEKLLAAK